MRAQRTHTRIHCRKHEYIHAKNTGNSAAITRRGHQLKCTQPRHTYIINLAVILGFLQAPPPPQKPNGSVCTVAASSLVVNKPLSQSSDVACLQLYARPPKFSCCVKENRTLIRQIYRAISALSRADCALCKYPGIVGVCWCPGFYNSIT